MAISDLSMTILQPHDFAAVMLGFTRLEIYQPTIYKFNNFTTSADP